MNTTLEATGTRTKWWVGCETQCYHCGTKIALDEKTSVMEVASYEGRFVYFDCPECGSKSISLSEGECPPD